MTEHEKTEPAKKTSAAAVEDTPSDAAVAVSLLRLRLLVKAAEKHAGKDEQLAAALTEFADL